MSDPNPNGALPALMGIRLADGRSATISLTDASTAIAVEELRVFSYDLGGRPFALVDEEWTSRRALDGWLLQKRPASPDGLRSRARRVLSPAEGAGLVEEARLEATRLLASLDGEDGMRGGVRAEAIRRLNRIVAMDAAALASDADRFAATYSPVGILPPDQYLALVLQATEGCPWNECTFCDFYRGVPFHVKTVADFEDHMAAVRDYFGESLALRRRLFLGDASALCIPHERLLALLEAAVREFPVVPRGLSPRERRSWLRGRAGGVTGIYSFADAWTGRRKRVAEYRDYARLGLRRVYIGLETGDPQLLAWLEKPGSHEDGVALVFALHEAGIAVGVIVLIGAGGETFFESHVRRTAEVLSRMRLGPEDLLYFSELVEHPSLEYARRAGADGIRPLDPERCAAQRRAIASSFQPADPARPPRASTYDIREFVY